MWKTALINATKNNFFSNSEHILCVRHLQANALRKLLKQNVPEKTRNSIVQKHFFQKQAFSVQKTGFFFNWIKEQEILVEFTSSNGSYLSKNYYQLLNLVQNINRYPSYGKIENFSRLEGFEITTTS